MCNIISEICHGCKSSIVDTQTTQCRLMKYTGVCTLKQPISETKCYKDSPLCNKCAHKGHGDKQRHPSRSGTPVPRKPLPKQPLPQIPNKPAKPSKRQEWDALQQAACQREQDMTRADCPQVRSQPLEEWKREQALMAAQRNPDKLAQRELMDMAFPRRMSKRHLNEVRFDRADQVKEFREDDVPCPKKYPRGASQASAKGSVVEMTKGMVGLVLPKKG